MLKSIEAVFDGTVFRPVEEVDLNANTRVRLLFEVLKKETLLEENSERLSFMDVALQLELDGPPDWSSRIANS